MVQGWHAAKVGLDRLLIPTAVVANLFRSARDFRRGAAQPIRSSNSRSRLPRDQRSTTESTEIHGKENPNQLPLSVLLTVKIFEACADFLTPDGLGSCRKRRNFGAHRSLVQSCGCGLAALGFPWLPVCDDLSCLGNNTSSTGFSGWHMSVAVPRRQARLAREGALVDHQVPHPDHHPRPRSLAHPARFSCNIPSRSPFSIPRCAPPHLGSFAAPARCRDSPRKVEKSGQEKRLHYKSDSSAISSIFASSSGSTSPSTSEFDAMNWAAHCKSSFVRNSLLLVRSAKVTR